VRTFIKVAEKRKCLLDELAIKYQQEIDQHREQTKTLNDKIITLTDELNNYSQLSQVS